MSVIYYQVYIFWTYTIMIETEGNKKLNKWCYSVPTNNAEHTRSFIYLKKKKKIVSRNLSRM